MRPRAEQIVAREPAHEDDRSVVRDSEALAGYLPVGQPVPIGRLMIFDPWPECGTMRPVPSRIRCCTRVTIPSRTSSRAM